MAGATLLLWIALLSLILLRPFPVDDPYPGDDLVRNTIRLALLYYAFAATMMLRLQPEDWRAATSGGRLAQLLWSLAWLAYVIHLGMAFHYAHGWSHANAMQHTEDVSGIGEGIFVSHLFTLLWTADVFWWWLTPVRYAARPSWLDRVLHGFMFFVIFNATVVYETGFIRWAGLTLFVWLATLFYQRSITPTV